MAPFSGRSCATSTHTRIAASDSSSPWFALFLSWILTACSATAFDGSVCRGDGFAFRIPPPPSEWRRLEVSNAVLAFRDETNHGTIMIHARCGLDGDDVPLSSLTQHLFLQFTEREIQQQQIVPFDGREALHTVLDAKLDGVAMSYDVWVLKKDGCVYDLLYLAPRASFRQGLNRFEMVVRGFATVSERDN